MEQKHAVSLLPALHELQSKCAKVSAEQDRRIADTLNLPLSQVAGAATFFSAFTGGDDGTVDETMFATPHGAKLLAGDPDYASVRKMVEERPDLLALIDETHILGRSGSGFPMSTKWKMTAEVDGEEKYIVCNGSEGEGNTYKDAALFTHAPTAVIAGMVLCALVTGIRKGYLYIRAEYKNAYDAVCKAVKEAYDKNILGGDILGSGKAFDLEVVLGGGAYVSGEETGLLQALEGQRSEPRLKPPYPGVSGLYGKPTIINNAETFAAVTCLMQNGVEFFLENGTETAGGTKLYTITGCVGSPGVYELPHKTTLAQAIQAAGGIQEDKAFKGIQIGGGATGSFGGRDVMDMVLDYDGCRRKGLSLGTGSIYCIAEDESVIALCHNSIAFLAEQSCGMCAPCRYGLAEMRDHLARIISGDATTEALEALENLADYIGQNARCALGQAAPGVFTTAYHAFPEEFRAACKEVETYAFL